MWAGAALAVLLLRPFWGALLDAAPACRFQQWTGWPCLTCGSSRSVQGLLTGDWGAALSSNPLTTITLILFLAGGAAAGLWLLGLGPEFKGLPPKAARRLVLGWLLVLVGNWVYLLLTHA